MTRALLGLGLLVAAALAVWALADHPVVLGIAFVTAGAWVALEARLQLPQPAMRSWLPPLALVLIVARVCGPTLAGDFVGDDFGYIGLFHGKSLASFARLGDISEGIWGKPLDELRPVFALSYKLGSLLHGASAIGFHAANLAVHLLACLLVYALVRALQPRDSRPALAASLLFGLMPVHAEPIAWVTGKVDSLPTLFYLAVLLLFVRFRGGASRAAYLGALGLYAVGLFSKEILITLPATLLAYDLLLARHSSPASQRPQGRGLLVHVPFLALTAGFLSVRHALFDSFAREGRGLSAQRLEAFLHSQPEKLRWLLAPFERWSWSSTLLAGLMAGCVAGAAFWLWRRRREYEGCSLHCAFFGLVFYGLTLLPLAVTYTSARHLYLPSAGVAMALGLLFVPVTTDGRARFGVVRLASLLLLLVVSALGLRRTDERWVAAGRVSRTARAQIELATRPLAPGSAVVLSGVPGMDGSIVVWKFALPFALQPPFVARDAYAPYRVIEPPDLYCCPLDAWWRAKRPVLSALLAGDPETTVELALVHWNAQREKIVLRQGRPLRKFLRAQLTRATGVPIESMDTIDGARAQRLMTTLEDVVRLSAPNAPEDPGE